MSSLGRFQLEFLGHFREPGNAVHADYVGIRFSYSLLTNSKFRAMGHGTVASCRLLVLLSLTLHQISSEALVFGYRAHGFQAAPIWSHMSYSQYFLPNLMEMGSLLGTTLGIILKYKRTPMSTLKGPYNKANIDRSSYLESRTSCLRGFSVQS